jgi:hypothetical protein
MHIGADHVPLRTVAAQRLSGPPIDLDDSSVVKPGL